MKSLRKTMETCFAAAAFAERNLHDEARGMLQELPKAQAVVEARNAAKKRQRPSLKA